MGLLVVQTARGRVPELSLDSELGRLIVRVSDPVPAFPLFRWTATARGVHAADRVCEEETELSHTEWMVTPPLRGSYTFEVRVVLADRLGWSRWAPSVSWTATIVVEPHRREPVRVPAVASRRGHRRTRRAGQRVGDPFDVRPYAPGDDLRRLHWPLYAHSGHLFVRTASVTPPPVDHTFVVLDLTAASNSELDARLETLAGWIEVWEREHRSWTIAVPALDTALADQPGPFLAQLSPCSGRSSISGLWPEDVLLLCGAKGREDDALAHALTQSRRTVTIVHVDRDPEPARTRAWWSR